MFYEPQYGHGLPHDPFKSLIVPRPIGWISTIDRVGRSNLAPYSFFNAMSTHPPCVAFGAGSRAGGAVKDSCRNAEETGCFVVNLATYAMREAVSISGGFFPPGASEFDAAGVEVVPSRIVSAPRVKGAPVHLECTYLKTIELPSFDDLQNIVVFGQVVGVHIDDSLLVDGRVDIARAQPIARLGYADYALLGEIFELPWRE